MDYRKDCFKIITAFFVFSILISSCKPAYKAFVPQYKKSFQNNHVPDPDYSDLHYWAAHPLKNDPSDSIPQPLLNEKRDTSADVFFLHPTTLTSKKTRGVIWNADINDANINAKTDYTSILYQASAFNASTRVFAPRYRQAHIFSFYSKDTLKSKQALDLAYEDVKRAFEYYLEHYNYGRPVIIASHSQGTVHAARLLKEFFEKKPLQNKLVCAYLIGMVLPKSYVTSIPPCTDSLSIGCFTGWRTFRKGYVPKFVQKENGSSWVVNPLSWTTDSIVIKRNVNMGAVLLNFNEIIPEPNGAQIHKGILWVERPKFPGSLFYLSRNYHPGDLNLFYMNLRYNVKRRIESYFQQEQR
jgi:hypothetical protein